MLGRECTLWYPVSYTHLDVYKRQSYCSTDLQTVHNQQYEYYGYYLLLESTIVLRFDSIVKDINFTFLSTVISYTFFYVFRREQTTNTCDHNENSLIETTQNFDLSHCCGSQLLFLTLDSVYRLQSERSQSIVICETILTSLLLQRHRDKGCLTSLIILLTLVR